MSIFYLQPQPQDLLHEKNVVTAEIAGKHTFTVALTIALTDCGSL